MAFTTALKRADALCHVRRILITFNIKDFVKLVELSNETGVIGVSANLPTRIIDQKLTTLFRKTSTKSLLGKLTILTGET